MLFWVMNVQRHDTDVRIAFVAKVSYLRSPVFLQDVEGLAEDAFGLLGLHEGPTVPRYDGYKGVEE